MTNEQAKTESITVYPTDREVIEAVMRRNGQSFSGALRFIIRDWRRLSDPDNTITSLPQPRQASRRRKVNLEKIPGVTRGLKAEAA
jgi:hypothetical protein